jgi:hypothetical protein
MLINEVCGLSESKSVACIGCAPVSFVNILGVGLNSF